MPTTLRLGSYRFYFYSQDCMEPRHTHVDRENLSAKLWLDPEVRLAFNHGFTRSELRRIERLTIENVEKLRHEWTSYCSDSSPT